MDRTYAHRIIEAAEITKMLPIGNKPANEAQARELAPLKDQPGVAKDVMNQLLQEKGAEKITAGDVRPRMKPGFPECVAIRHAFRFPGRGSSSPATTSKAPKW